ncbi:hypothetical protein [Zhihengliuella halotolerans]|uniref:Uncharacterized protein n=1 Tax=Zhihengliuella halotolerans TaxID=370736 RepID=A0A4Q8AAA7_9MICC|nr:hypothetical protein [Zhihengliuella halotolerans]RZU60894.1 hypothetical protein EV380_0445 [Zhihengliuella halotolerans]
MFSLVAVVLFLREYTGGEAFAYGLLGGASAAIGRWVVRPEAPVPVAAAG